MSSSDINLSAVLHGKLDLRLEERPVPKADKNEVVVAMSRVGLCGTDVHMWQNGECGDLVVREPLVIGHESSGVVSEVGASVTHLKVGDRVAIELGMPCRRCELCRCGKYNLCKPFSAGALTRYMVYAADFCYKLPDHLTMEDGALMEPLAVAVRAARRAGIALGSSVLICGAGPIGLACLLTAKAMGAAKVCLTDLTTGRLQLAKSMGATHTVLVDSKDPEITSEKVIQTLGGRAEFSIDCSGAEASLKTALMCTKTGGVMVPVALDPPVVSLPLQNHVIRREIDIRGVFSYANDYQPAISMIAGGKVDPKPMISHRLPLEQVLEAFDLTLSRKDGVVKVMIDCEKHK